MLVFIDCHMFLIRGHELIQSGLSQELCSLASLIPLLQWRGGQGGASNQSGVAQKSSLFKNVFD